MAKGDNNNMAARSYSKEFKELLQAVFAQQSYFGDFFGGGLEALDGIQQKDTAFSVKTSDVPCVVRTGSLETGGTPAYDTGADVAFGEGTGSTSRFGERTEIIYVDEDVPYAPYLEYGTRYMEPEPFLNSGYVYFVQDNNGDYVVDNVHYSVVTEPKLADISTYYELSIDESLNNYVATHLAVTSEGLWIIPDAGGNKVLIATGQGSTYTTAGTYIVEKVNNIDTVLASFTADGVQIGQTGETNALFDEDSFIMRDSRGNELAHIGSPIGARLTDTFVYSNSSTFTLSNTPSGSLSVKINNTTTTSYTQSGKSLTITATMTEGDVITAQYNTASRIKYFSFGNRRGDAGDLSMAEGDYTIASGESSHAEGYNTKANGYCSHAEGYGTIASGFESHAEGLSTTASGMSSHAEGDSTIASGFRAHAEGGVTIASGSNSHAQNFGTIAAKKYQTAIGRYNIEDTEDAEGNQKAFIIGNGESDSARSNAFTVDWDGNTEMQGRTTTADMTTAEITTFINELRGVTS